MGTVGVCGLCLTINTSPFVSHRARKHSSERGRPRDPRQLRPARPFPRARPRRALTRATSRDDVPVRERITTTAAPPIVSRGRPASVDAVPSHGVVLPQGWRPAMVRLPSVGVFAGVPAADSRVRRRVSPSSWRARTRFSLRVTHGEGAVRVRARDNGGLLDAIWSSSVRRQSPTRRRASSEGVDRRNGGRTVRARCCARRFAERRAPVGCCRW